jgi:hypothetical protein
MQQNARIDNPREPAATCGTDCCRHLLQWNGGNHNMDETYPCHRHTSPTFGTIFLSLALALLLTACGGGANDGTANNDAANFDAANSATLAWDPPATGTNLAGYRMYYGTVPGTYLQPFGQGLSVGNITTYTLMGLSHGTRYYFAVTAFDTMGNESVYSNETFKDIP